MDVFTSDEANLFSEIYGKKEMFFVFFFTINFCLETILTRKAFHNSCLLITFYTRSDLDEVNTLNSVERQQIFEEFRSNERFRKIFDYFQNRIFFVDLRQEEDLTAYPIGSLRYLRYRTLNEFICERKQIVLKHLNKFIRVFSPGEFELKFELELNTVFFSLLERFDCENLKNLREILIQNEKLERKLNEYRQFVMDIAEQRSTTNFYELLRFMPITNMFVDIFGKSLNNIKLSLETFFLHLELNRREKLDKRIEKLLGN